GRGHRRAQGADRPAPQAGAEGLLGEPRRVLLLVVRAEPPGALDRLPPVAVVAVPVDRRADALLPLPARLPAERSQLRRVERVAAVVSRAVLDVPDQRRVDAEMIA